MCHRFVVETIDVLSNESRDDFRVLQCGKCIVGRVWQRVTDWGIAKVRTEPTRRAREIKRDSDGSAKLTSISVCKIVNMADNEVKKPRLPKLETLLSLVYKFLVLNTVKS